MPSILNTPANKIPLHLFCLPIAQREILLVNVLTDPILYEQIISSTLYHNDPTFTQAIIIFQNYVLIRQLFSRLAVPRLLVQIVTVRGRGLIFSIIHLPPLTADSPFTFTILVVFFVDTFRYVVW